MQRFFSAVGVLVSGASLTLTAPVVAAQPSATASTTATAAIATAQPTAELVTLVNQFRNAPHKCGNTRMRPAAPLLASPALEQARLPNAGTLIDGLRGIGYPAASGYIIQVSGTASPVSAMKAIERAYCAALMSADYTEIGIRLDGQQWRILLARRTR